MFDVLLTIMHEPLTVLGARTVRLLLTPFLSDAGRWCLSVVSVGSVGLVLRGFLVYDHCGG